MSRIKIYHNPRCRKSREGLKYLEAKGIQPDIIQYMNSPLSEEEVKGLLGMLNLKPIDLVRTQEEMYRKELRNKSLSDKEWVEILSKNPQLIKRPIVVKDHKAAMGDPPRNIDNVL